MSAPRTPARPRLRRLGRLTLWALLWLAVGGAWLALTLVTVGLVPPAFQTLVLVAMLLAPFAFATILRAVGRR